MLEKIRKINPNLPIFSVFDEEFSEYGRVVDTICPDEFLKASEKIDFPNEGSVYIPSVKQFEELEDSKKIEQLIFGTLDTQVGYCYGYNSILNATEWHHSSELNIALTPLVLILGRRCDIKEGRMASSSMKAFYLPRGAVVEVYATSTHFCPCQVEESGFGCVVALPRGTNTPLDSEVSDPFLFRKNKWIIAHEDNSSLVARGVKSGIYGENFKIKF